MKLNYVTDNILAELKVNAKSNINHYKKNNKEWFNKYFENTNGLKEEIFPGNEIELVCEGEYIDTDFENIKRMYGGLKDIISPKIAIDERLWVGLAHSTYWDYVQYRQKEQITSKKGKIETSFFFTYGPRRSAYVNCLSRLWWAGYLFYDEECKNNPWHLVRALVGTDFASAMLLLSSSGFIANKNIALGLMESIKKLRNKGIQIKRRHWVESTKYLNNIGAMMILDELERSEITQIIDDLFIKLELDQPDKKDEKLAVSMNS